MKRVLLLVLLMFTTVLLVGCDLFQTEEPPREWDLYFKGVNAIELEVGTPEPDWLTLVEIVDETGRTYEVTEEMIVNNDVDMTQTGFYQVLYVAEGVDEEFYFYLEVNVIDTTAPYLSNDGNVLVFTGSTMDLTGYPFPALDNSGQPVVVEVLSTPVLKNIAGTYPISLRLTDESGNIAYATYTITVLGPELATGVYDFTTLPVEAYQTIVASMEIYMLENMIGGVPLYTSGSFVMFSDRIRIDHPDYNVVMGFGEDTARIIVNDWHATMLDGTSGNMEDYTWRLPYDIDPETFNPYLLDTELSLEQYELLYGRLYRFDYGDADHSYQLVPDMAASEPIPVDPSTVDGTVESTKWLIPIEPDQVWSFYPDTDKTSFGQEYWELTAEDWVYTWEIALQNEWLRAVSTGGDFISMGIVNAAEFVDGTVTNFGDVGIDVTDEMIELEFDTPKRAFDVMYMLSSIHLSPIQKDVYEYCVSEGLDYGSSPDTMAYAGPYVLEEWVVEDHITFSKNPMYWDEGLYQPTGYLYRYMADEDVFQAFLDGLLDKTDIPTQYIETYRGEPNVFDIPGSAVFSLMINGFGIDANRDQWMEDNPTKAMSTVFELEPILMYLEMKQAFYYGIDRSELAIEQGVRYIPAHLYFSDNYILSAESGVAIHDGEIANSFLTNYLVLDVYNEEEALNLFQSAVTKAIEDGYYIAGTAESPTVIELVLSVTATQHEDTLALYNNLIDQYEALFYDDVNHVQLDLTLQQIVIANVYDYFRTGGFDLGIGGISPCLLCHQTMFGRFRDDNRDDFTMNFGIDTSTPNILIVYTDMEGETHSEIWSFNALEEALEGKVYVRDGVKQTTWVDPEDMVAASLDLDDLMVDEITSETTIGIALYGSFFEFKQQNHIDDVKSYIVTTTNGEAYYFFLTQKEGEYSIYHKQQISTDPTEAILGLTGYHDYFIRASGPMTDAEIAADSYLQNFFPTYTSLAAIATGEDAPLEYAEAFQAEWDGWNDVVLLLHIGEYYIGYAWL